MSDEAYLLDTIRRLEGSLEAAIRQGNKRNDEMLQFFHQLRRMRREIRRAIVLLRTGRSSDALIILQSLSREEKPNVT